MGKSTVAQMLIKLGVPVHDADTAVHALLAQGGAAENLVIEAFPSLTSPIDRKALGALIFNNPAARVKLEAILHPLVRAEREAFMTAQQKAGTAIAAADIPLLYETGAQGDFDAIIVVTAPPALQHKRVMARPNMTEGKLAAILARQIPDEDKRARADYVVQTDKSLDDTLAQLREIIASLK